MPLLGFGATEEPKALKGSPMIGYFIISAVVVLLGLAMYLGASVAITYRDSDNAADIIAAMGKSFPLKGLWSRRK